MAEENLVETPAETVGTKQEQEISTDTQVVKDGDAPEVSNEGEATEKKEYSEEEKQAYGLRKRVDKLTAQKHELTRQLEEMKRLRSQNIQEPKSKEPKEDDFESYEKFIAAKAIYDHEQERARVLAKEKADAENLRRQRDAIEVQQRLDKSEEAFKATVPDYADAFYSFEDSIQELDVVPENKQILSMMMVNHQNPAELLYILGKNPSVIEKIKTCRPVDVSWVVAEAYYENKGSVKQQKALPKPPSPTVAMAKPKKDISSMSYEETLKALNIKR